MREGWLIDANDHWVWRFVSIGTTPPGSEIPRSSLTVGVRCLKVRHCSKSVGICEKRCRAVVEVAANAGVEEDNSLVGCKR